MEETQESMAGDKQDAGSEPEERASIGRKIGIALGIVVLGEHITPVIGLGLVASIIGVAAINIPARPKWVPPG